MTRRTVLIGSAAAVCAALLIAVLATRAGRAPAAGPEAGAATGEAPGGPAGAGAGETAGAVETPGAAAGEGPRGEAPGGGPREERAGATVTEATPAPSFTSEQNRREVTLFFQEKNSEYLGPERRKIFLTSSIVDQAKQIVVELINGPLEADLLPTFPQQTRLRGLYLGAGGTAYVDLSGELVEFHPGGTDEEIATIFSLVDSLAYNLPEIKRVRILVNGEERDTLKEHLDLRRTYVKDMSIVDMDRKSAQ